MSAPIIKSSIIRNAITKGNIWILEKSLKSMMSVRVLFVHEIGKVTLHSFDIVIQTLVLVVAVILMIAYFNIKTHIPFLNSAPNYFAVNNFEFNMNRFNSTLYYLNEPVFINLFNIFRSCWDRKIEKMLFEWQNVSFKWGNEAKWWWVFCMSLHWKFSEFNLYSWKFSVREISLLASI